jgi:hypothetical protein
MGKFTVAGQIAESLKHKLGHEPTPSDVATVLASELPKTSEAMLRPLPALADIPDYIDIMENTRKEQLARNKILTRDLIIDLMQLMGNHYTHEEECDFTIEQHDSNYVDFTLDGFHYTVMVNVRRAK